MKELKRNAHPGWAVQDEGGGWLCYGHGFFLSEDAFYADVVLSEEDAKHLIKEANEDFENNTSFNIVLAWEPLCESLRHEVAALKEANTISPSKIMDIVIDLQGVIADLKRK